jgi:peptidyl-prolyl cis-trans isomerase B (cyclophilin B)
MHILIEIETYGVITLELYKEHAPKTVENFVSLVEKGFYNGLTFHRIIKGFMIQGGCPLGTGTGGPGHQIEGEFSSNGYDNPIRHEKGVISMARSQSPNSAGSQFFIMHETSTHLDGQYAAFGKVIEGLDIIDSVASVQTGFQDKPVVPVKITSITVKS